MLTEVDLSALDSFNRVQVIRQFILPLLVLLPALILTSCLEGEEEIWINADASGRLVAHYDVPARVLTELGDPEDFIRALRLVDEGEDGIEISELQFTQSGGRAVFHLEATFQDARELLSISERNEELFIEETNSDPENLDGIAGDINFDLKWLTPTFHRTVSPADIFPEIVKKRPKMLGPATFKYTIHLPAAIKESNAHVVSDDGKTVSWAFRLSEHFDQPMEMSFTTELPIPWWAWVILALLGGLLVWLVWRFLVRRLL